LRRGGAGRGGRQARRPCDEGTPSLCLLASPECELCCCCCGAWLCQLAKQRGGVYIGRERERSVHWWSMGVDSFMVWALTNIRFSVVVCYVLVVEERWPIYTSTSPWQVSNNPVDACMHADMCYVSELSGVKVSARQETTLLPATLRAGFMICANFTCLA
jgi:hypothetical protein